MNINERAALIIRSLMRQLPGGVTDHIVWLGTSPDRGYTASKLLEDLEASPKVGDGTGDAAIAIGEDAFGAGWDAALDHVGYVQNEDTLAPRIKAWGEYDPPEHIKALS